MNLEGKWIGTLTYGESYGKWAGETLQFEMQLTEHNNLITGTSTDIQGWGLNPSPAEIRGEQSGNSITFIKQYRSFQLAGSPNLIIKRQKGPEIIYSGVYIEDERSFQGEWTIKVKHTFFGLIPLNRRSSGTWTMERNPLKGA